MTDIVVVGDINVDILAPIDHYPRPGGHGLADGLHIRSGGSAANTAVVLGGLGWRVVLFGRVGNDPLAEWALRSPQDAGVDISGVRRVAGMTTGLFLVAITPDGERTMFGGRGANGWLSPEDIEPATIKAAQWLHLSGYPLLSASGRAALEKAAAVAQQAGIRTSLDVGVGPATPEWHDTVVEFASGMDVILPNQMEAAFITGTDQPAEAARRLHARGVQTVVIKLGGEGCYVSAGGEDWAMPAFEVELVDSTGAGDAFNAGFIAGQLTGFDLRASALLASALGGLAATVMGAGSALPGPARVGQFLEQQRDLPQWADWAAEFDLICNWLEEKRGT